jgi:triosephosphate isomerase
VDSGIPWVILGHSERRTLFHETSEVVADKTKAAIDTGLSSCRLSFRFCGMDFDTWTSGVILCVGETLEEREAGATAKVVEAQLEPVVKAISQKDWRCSMRTTRVWPAGRDWSPPLCSKIVVAYEPVWAIGTGKVATSAQAQEAHHDIRAFLSKVRSVHLRRTRMGAVVTFGPEFQAVSQDVAESTRIIYGGSVTAKNSKELGTRLHLPLPLHDPSHTHRYISDAAGRRRLPRRRRIAQARVRRHYQLEEGGLGPPRERCCEQGRQDGRRVFSLKIPPL